MAGPSRSRSGPAATGEIRALTGLRGVAACYVVLYHMLQDAPGESLVLRIVRHGYIAVDLFFVMSGFVLALVHGRDRFDRAGYGLFVRKRLARIYPLYAAVTMATLLLVGFENREAVSPAQVAVNALLVQGWGAGASIVAPAWSLSTEFGASLLFPLLVPLLLGGSRRQAGALAAVAKALLAVLSLGGPQPRSGPLDLYQPHIAAPLLRCLADFTLGLAAFRLRGWIAAAPRSGPSWGVTVLGGAMAALLAWPGADLAIVGLAVPFMALLAARGPADPAGRLLGAPLPHWLGRVSFSIYLVHFPIREWLRGPLAERLAASGLGQSHALATVTACVVTLAVATLTHRLIERPGRAMLLGRTGLAGPAACGAERAL